MFKNKTGLMHILCSSCLQILVRILFVYKIIYFLFFLFIFILYLVGNPWWALTHPDPFVMPPQLIFQFFIAFWLYIFHFSYANSFDCLNLEILPNELYIYFYYLKMELYVYMEIIINYNGLEILISHLQTGEVGSQVT